jgi:histidine ammonia-lyase
MRDAVRERVPVLEHDRRQDIDIEQVLRLHREGLLPCPAPTDGSTAEA